MMRTTLCCILLAGCMQYGYAQEQAAPEVKKEKKIDHYVGVQMNGLIRQVINFNNNTNTTPVNPYLITYSVNLAKSGWGLRAGVGYVYNSATTDNGITKTVSKINDMNVRFGIEKRFKLSNKWSAGAGIDGVMSRNDDITTSTIQSFDTTTTITKSKLPTLGGGVMGWLRYAINDRVLIGTESSFYYVTGTESREVTTTRKRQSTSPPFTMITTTTVTKSKPVFTDGSFRLPVVFYLIVRI